MARAKHPCAEPGCPTPVDAGTPRCPEHTKARDKARGTTKQRGYTGKYRTLRDQIESERARTPMYCWRCGEQILPSGRWNLGHDDHDRTVIRGPEHEHCNLSAAGRASH